MSSLAARHRLAAGVRIEAVGEGWVAFSPLSGETLLLNDEAAAILEVLGGGATTIGEVCASLAADLDDDPDALRERIAPHWHTLTDAGLVLHAAP